MSLFRIAVPQLRNGRCQEMDRASSIPRSSRGAVCTFPAARLEMLLGAAAAGFGNGLSGTECTKRFLGIAYHALVYAPNALYSICRRKQPRRLTGLLVSRLSWSGERHTRGNRLNTSLN